MKNTPSVKVDAFENTPADPTIVTAIVSVGITCFPANRRKKTGRWLSASA